MQRLKKYYDSKPIGSRFVGILILFCILSLISVTPAQSQTTSGYNGSFIVPWADTYNEGNFLLGGTFRSMSYGNKRHDGAPMMLVTGLTQSSEIGFSLPSLNGASDAPSYVDDFAQLNYKRPLKKRYSNGLPVNISQSHEFIDTA